MSKKNKSKISLRTSRKNNTKAGNYRKRRRIKVKSTQHQKFWEHKNETQQICKKPKKKKGEPRISHSAKLPFKYQGLRERVLLHKNSGDATLSHFFPKPPRECASPPKGWSSLGRWGVTSRRTDRKQRTHSILDLRLKQAGGRAEE